MFGAPTDEALVRLAQRGDGRAFDELVLRHRDRVYAVALRLCRNPSDAEDALQETFVSAYKSIGTFNRRARFSTWLYRIAFNASQDLIAKRRVSTSLDEDGAPDPVSRRDDVQTHLQRRAIERALADLPMDFREAVVLCDIAGLGAAEAGEVLGVPSGTVKSRVFRARAQLAAALREPGNPYAVQPTDPVKP